MPKVYIIIINYNSWRDTIECLESLKKITYPDHHILIIDNNSSDNSVKKIDTYLKKNLALHVTSYTLHANIGFAGGNNFAIKKALKESADYVLLLNPDTTAEANFLDKLIEIAEDWKKQGKVAFFGPRIYLQEARGKRQEAKIYSNGGLINWSQARGTLKDYGKFVSEVIKTEPFETDYVSGTCLLASKEVIEKVGLMREEYFLYYEDTDWCIRGRKQGIGSVIVPQSIIWHKMSTSTKEGSPSYIYYHVRNGLYCGWWNAKRSEKSRLAGWNGNLKKLVIIALSLWTFIKQPIKLFIPSKRKWAKPVMQGVIDFWRGRTGKL